MTKENHNIQSRLNRNAGPSLRNWQKVTGPNAIQMVSDTIVEMGWGRLFFGHTFDSCKKLARLICMEGEMMRDIAFYIRDPHVLISIAPDKLFLDPSHAFRLWAHDYHTGDVPPQAFTVRRLTSREDANAIGRIYAQRHMAGCNPEFILKRRAGRTRTYMVAESADDKGIIGTVTGVDHVEAFNDPENGSSLWSLAVDPKADTPGVGESLVRQLIEHYFARGRSFVDLSVMHDNREAIQLYEKLGFQRIPVFCIKRKNTINEALFVAAPPEESLNPYARIITDEARRRSISVEVVDAVYGYFTLKMGGRAITCRESLSELTSAIAMSRCDDKRLTHRVLHSAGLKTPAQQEATDHKKNMDFLNTHGRLVVKPARGEQGIGISVDIQSPHELERAIEKARNHCRDIILEAYVQGDDLRIIVINYNVVAAAVRKPPQITGTGRHSIQHLVKKYNRRRLAATGGESKVPMDGETGRCIKINGYEMDDVLPAGETITVRNTANLHTGGTIHDVTAILHPDIAKAAEKAATAIGIPVTGIDFIVPDIQKPDYLFIEANERPGLANHEPQPTAQRFIDFLFPETSSIRNNMESLTA